MLAEVLAPGTLPLAALFGFLTGFYIGLMQVSARSIP
jgi:hypothetical protein